MEQLVWIAPVAALLGVMLGGWITLRTNVFIKKIERANQLNILVSQKRLEAYEKLISIAQQGKTAVGDYYQGTLYKVPIILYDPENLDNWFIEFTHVLQSSYHLVDEDLSTSIGILKNYMQHLFNVLKPLRDSQGKFSDTPKLRAIGVLLYEDILRLNTDIIRKASLFLSKGLYDQAYSPAAASEEPDRGMPDMYRDLVLAKRETEIVKMIEKA